MLTGRTALVTGSVAGLGYALAEGLAAAGADVVINGLCTPEEGRAAADRLAAAHGVKTAFDPADLREAGQIESMVTGVIEHFGSLDIVVNNAVIRHFSSIEDFAPADWEESLAVNLTAPFHTARLALPGMKARGWGRIVNLSSYYGFRGAENRIDYVTTKTALIGMARAIAIETAGTGVTCNALCPGSVLTPAIEDRIAGIAAQSGEEVATVAKRYAADRSPMGRFVDPAKLAAALVFLCSPAGDDITGTALPVDCGWFAA